MIQVCLEKLLEAGLIEWQGSLRKTYLHYLSPDRLDLTSKEMFHHLNQGDVLGAFQFDSLSGEAILAKTKPETLYRTSGDGAGGFLRGTHRVREHALPLKSVLW